MFKELQTLATAERSGKQVQVSLTNLNDWTRLSFSAFATSSGKAGQPEATEDTVSMNTDISVSVEPIADAGGDGKNLPFII